MRLKALGFLAVGLPCVALYGASPAYAAVSSSSPLELSEPAVSAQARGPVHDRAFAATPPTMLAQTLMPTAIMRATPGSAIVAQGSVVRVVPPGGSQPGVLWVIAMGATLCRVGARVLRVS